MRYRSLLPNLAASALLLLGALNPVTVPRIADVKDVARKDTLVVSGFTPGPSEIVDPQNMNPYSLGGLGRVRDIRGWMSASDPYASPSSLWAPMELALLKIQPASAQ